MMMTPLSESASVSISLLSALFEALPDPVLVFNGEGTLVFTNPAADLLFAESDRAAPYAERMLPHGLEAVMRGAQTQAWYADEETPFLPTVLQLPDGKALLLRDRAELSRLMQSQHKFIHLVSHDLRSPLTAMKGFTNMLQDGSAGALNDKQQGFVDKIMNGIEQITAQVENIQDAGRFDPETGFYEMQRAACDVGAIIEKIVSHHLLPAEKGELTLRATVAPDLPILFADKIMLERAITNLVDNAIKYTPNGGVIDVRAERDEQGIRIAVIDSGYGISPDNQKLLFQRHARIARHEHRKVKGTGLGLFIVRSIAQRHGGRAWVESEEGKGSAFYLLIPRQTRPSPGV